MTMNHWQVYQPSDDAPWNIPRVWMLHRRAGFGANWQRLQHDLKNGPVNTLERILAAQEELENEFENTSRQLLKKAIQSGQIARLSAWWIQRMYLGRHPFVERQTLIWHNHFATSNRAIQSLPRMYRQNHIFRKFGTGTFTTLLDKVIKDPAMLMWLNANDNRRGHPNENLGRELLELFSIGVGHYAERDVKEAARALAGWTVVEENSTTTEPFSGNGDKLKIRRIWQDNYEKTILGKTGYWDGNDLLRIVLEHPATAHRLAWRICDELLGENVVSQPARDELAVGLIDNGLDLNWAFKTVLSSQLFFSHANLKSRIAPPETFTLGALKALMTESIPASTLALNNVFSSLGRTLFQPPNVGGWDGGRTWLNARTLVARSNFVHAVIDNGLNRKSLPPDFDAIVDSFNENNELESIVGCWGELLLGLDRNTKEDQRFIQAVASEAEKQPPKNRWAFTAHLLLNSGSAQLC